MMLNKIADEIELLIKADRWLDASLTVPATWKIDEQALRHRDSVRRSQSASIGARFTGSEVHAKVLASSLAYELRRLCDGPRVIRMALEHAVWPEYFKSEGRIILSGFDEMPN